MTAAFQLWSDHDFATKRPRLITMHDQDDHENPDTMAPDTDRHSTLPPGPDDAAAAEASRTLLPLPPRAPSTLEDTYLDRAIRVVAETGASMARDRDERRMQHEAVLAAIVRSDQNQSRNYELLRDEIRHLKDSDRRQDERLIEGEKRFSQIEQSIANLKEELLALVTRAGEDAARRIAALENDLAELRTNAARTAQTPATPA